MKNPLGVSPSKGYQGTTRGKEKILMTSVGIEPTTSGLDLPLLCRLSYVEVGQRKSGTIKVVNRGEDQFFSLQDQFFSLQPCLTTLFLVLKTKFYLSFQSRLSDMITKTGGTDLAWRDRRGAEPRWCAAYDRNALFSHIFKMADFPRCMAVFSG